MPNLQGLNILFVCEGNICRSPVLAFAVGVSTDFQVDSAGWGARDAARMCNMGAERIAGLPGGSEYAGSFRSRSIDLSRALDADIIFTATTELRSKLLQSQPRLVGYVFSVLEAVALMAEPLSRIEVVKLQRDGIAVVLSGRRGTIAISSGQSARCRGNRDRLDIPDGHDIRSVAKHRAAVDAAVLAGTLLQARLLAWKLAASPYGS